MQDVSGQRGARPPGSQVSCITEGGVLSQRSSAPGVAGTTNHNPQPQATTLRPIWDPGCRASASWHRDKPLDWISQAPQTNVNESTLPLLLDGIRRPKGPAQLCLARKGGGNGKKENGKRRQQHSNTATQPPLTRDKPSDPPPHTPLGTLIHQEPGILRSSKNELPRCWTATGPFVYTTHIASTQSLPIRTPLRSQSLAVVRFPHQDRVFVSVAEAQSKALKPRLTATTAEQAPESSVRLA